MRKTIALTLILGPTILAGCGDDGRERRFPASGRVVVAGRPEAGVEVRLYPADRIGDLDALRPYATTDEDGAFRLGTFEEADGAPAGSYKLTLFWPDRPPGPSPPDDLLGGRYANPERTEFEATIAEGENDLGTFEAERTTAPPARPAGAGRFDPDGFGDAGGP